MFLKMMRAIVVLVLLGAMYEVVPLPTIPKCTKVVDIALVVDESGSIKFRNFLKIKTFLKDIVSKFSVSTFGVHFGLITYSTHSRVVFTPNEYTDAEEMQKSIEKMDYKGGRTFTGAALSCAKNEIFNQQVDRLSVPNVLIIFTDGAAHDYDRAKRIANEMKQDGVVILGVVVGSGITNNRLKGQLRQLVSKSVDQQTKYIFESTFELLTTIEDTLAKEVCEAIDPCNAKPCLNNATCSRVGNDAYTCQCPANFEGPHCELPKWCPKASFTKQGCYKIPRQVKENKAKPLFNRRNDIDWQDGWDKYLEDIVCDCSAAARENNHKYFWIEFYGECWGYGDLDFGEITSSQCWGQRPTYQDCIHAEQNPICVGKASHGYVYKLKEQPNTTN